MLVYSLNLRRAPMLILETTCSLLPAPTGGMLARTYAAVQDSCIEKDRGYSGKVYAYSVQSTEFLHDGQITVDTFVE